MPIRLATWNIGGGFRQVGHNSEEVEDIGYFTNQLKKLECDVVCIQEAHSREGGSEASQAERLAELAGFDYCVCKPYGPYCPSHLKQGERLSLAILSRCKPMYEELIPLWNPNLDIEVDTGSKWRTHDRAILNIVVPVDSLPASIFCLHLLPFHRFHRDALDSDFDQVRCQIQDAVLLRRGVSPIIAGDLNHSNPCALLPRLWEAGFFMAFDVLRTDRFLGEQVDHILPSAGWKVINWMVYDSKSDHDLCMVELARC